MISWGVEVNDYGNAIQDGDGNFIKVPDQGVTAETWQRMTAYAAEKGWKGGNYKNLNLPLDNLLQAQDRAVRQRMVKRVEEFVYTMLTRVFNADGTASLAKELILKADSHDLGSKGRQLENPEEWTRELIIERAKSLDVDKGGKGDFDD
jgi:fructose-bisphosphate aldolase, class II